MVPRPISTTDVNTLDVNIIYIGHDILFLE